MIFQILTLFFYRGELGFKSFLTLIIRTKKRKNQKELSLCNEPNSITGRSNHFESQKRKIQKIKLFG